MKMTLATVYIHIMFSIYLTSTGIVAADDLSSLLNRLYNSAAQNNKPLVLVLDKHNVRDEQKYPVKPNNMVGASLDTEEEVPPAVYLIQSQVPPSPLSQKRVPPVNGLGSLGNLVGLGSLGSLGNLGNLGSLGSLSNLGGLFDVPVNWPRSNQLKVNKGQLTGVGQTTPSAIQKLLRQSECDATDACIEKCKNRFQGKKRITCKSKCEVTFECPPMSDHDEDYDDPCEDEYNEC